MFYTCFSLKVFSLSVHHEQFISVLISKQHVLSTRKGVTEDDRAILGQFFHIYNFVKNYSGKMRKSLIFLYEMQISDRVLWR